MTRPILERQWLPVALTRELRDGVSSAQLFDHRLVVGYAGGKAFALDDRCPHRSAPLSAGKLVHPRSNSATHLLQCPYHGWRFDPSSGACVQTPGVCEGALPNARVPRYPACELGGVLFVRLAGDAPAPTLDDGGLDSFTMVHEVRAELPDVLENLLDGTHTPYVHAGWLRTERTSQRFRGTLSVSSDRAEVRYSGESGQAGWVSRIFERGRTESFGRFIPPSTAEIEYRSRRGVELRVEVYCAPVDDGVRAFSIVRTRRGTLPGTLKRRVLRPILRAIAEQDRRIVESQRENWRRFGSPRHHIAPGDLLRPAIDAYVRDGRLTNKTERTVEFEL